MRVSVNTKWTYVFTFCLVFSLFLYSSYVKADPSYLTFSAGYYDVFDDEEALALQLEYRDNTDLLIGIKPFVTAQITTDGSQFYGGGLYLDIPVTDSFYITPSFGALYFEQGGSNLDLGHPINFRSQLEFGYEMENDHRLSLGIAHYSNASLDDHNPGVEVLTIGYHYPFQNNNNK